MYLIPTSLRNVGKKTPMNTREGDKKKGCERGVFQVGKVTVSLRQWIQRIIIMWLGGGELTKG